MTIKSRLSGLLSKVSGIRNRRALLVEHSRRQVPKTVLDRELDRLIGMTMDIQQQAEWASHPHGEDFRNAISEEVARLLMQLPDAVLSEKDTAEAMAAMIKAYANVLRIFNSPVLEYDRVREIVDKRIGSVGD